MFFLSSTMLDLVEQKQSKKTFIKLKIILN